MSGCTKIRSWHPYGHNKINEVLQELEYIEHRIDFTNDEVELERLKAQAEEKAGRYLHYASVTERLERVKSKIDSKIKRLRDTRTQKSEDKETVLA